MPPDPLQELLYNAANTRRKAPSFFAEGGSFACFVLLISLIFAGMSILFNKIVDFLIFCND